MRPALAAAFASLALAAPASADTDPGTGEWEKVPRDRVAAECGMDPDMLEDASVRLTDSPFVVVRYGKLCWEGGYPGGTTQTYHIASVTKTFGALLTGMVDARGTLSDEDVITRWVPPAELNTVNPQARVAHVLSMAGTSEDLRYGKKKKWSYDTLGDREINQLVTVMNKAIAAEPDRFAGSKDAQAFAQREMFDRMGMKASDWPGASIAGTMNSTVRDMARMGELILQRGRYDGRQLLDEDYVYKLTHPAFEDSNTGYGYLTYLNADQNWGYSTGTNDTECAPYTRWPSYPHRPFFEAPDPAGGFPGEQKHDVGLVWAAGAGGQRIVVHRALDLVLAVRDDTLSVGQSEQVGTFEGHKDVFRAILPALVKYDPRFPGDEQGFCAAYLRSEHAPDLREPWFQAPASDAAAPAGGTGEQAPAVSTCETAAPFFDGFSVTGSARGALRVRVARRENRPFAFRLLSESAGRTLLPRRVVASRTSRSDAFSVRPRRGLRDGYYVADVRRGTESRRLVLRRVRGRFRAAPDAGLRRSCGVVEFLTLGRAVFGGRQSRSLPVAYALRRDADAVTVRVLGGGARAVRGGTAAGRVHRVRLSARGLRAGRDVRIQLRVRHGDTTTTEVVTARRL